MQRPQGSRRGLLLVAIKRLNSIDPDAKQTPGAVSRPGTLHEFQCPESAESQGRVKSFSHGGCPRQTLTDARPWSADSEDRFCTDGANIQLCRGSPRRRHLVAGRVVLLHSGVMSAGQCAHDPSPYARSSPANEAVVASGVRTEVFRQIAPRRPRSQDPEDAIEDATVVHPRHAARFVGSIGLMAAHSWPVSS